MDPRPAPWLLFSDNAELAVECARSAVRLDLQVEPRIAEDALPAATAALLDQGRVAVAVAEPPDPALLVALAAASRATRRPVPLAIVSDASARREALHVAGDLGLVAVDEVEPLLACVALVDAKASHPWTASTRGLTALDRTRLGGAAVAGVRGGGRFLRADDGMLAWSSRAREVLLGPPWAAGRALNALRTGSEAPSPARAVIEGVDRATVHQVIFGPPRALSDPASKAALEPYGLPMPLEELCTSPSRAAAEATRLGFPVRISLASPDLRVWDHLDLAVDGVDNAARVRDVYRQIMAMASERQPDARLLGVHVTATTVAQALLHVLARPLPEGYVHAQIGFADPHGRAAQDRTSTVLPATPEAIERVLSRLMGASLILGGTAAQRRTSVRAISDVLLRLAAFSDDYRDEVQEVVLHPLALLLGGATEVREACVTVSDTFLRTLDVPPTHDHA